ncbi:amidohydrolase family protein [uncultured Adlercreutzia sp.]|uniref:amidohydrolase family protein n=1 Tax=uncultured Adlercreutzia sp. TaxID=875803 RepID=UPI002676AD0F|nr:amidohydrolase family protein [uncultured Adlercreutzia sp.]
MSVIDAHSHIYPAKIASKASDAVGDFYHVSMAAPVASAEALLTACEGTPITHHLVHSVATTPGQVETINTFIADQCAEHPEFVGFATMHQDYVDMEGEIERAIELGLKGVKIHPDTQKVDMDDPRLMRLYEIIEGRLPIVIHTGDYRYDYSHPRRLKKILRAFPNLVVDAAHFGGWSVFDYALEYLEDERCYVDTSSALEFLGPRRTMELVRAYGVERVMFGSDFPMWSPATEYNMLAAMPFTPEEFEAITWSNAQRFIAGELPR